MPRGARFSAQLLHVLFLLTLSQMLQAAETIPVYNLTPSPSPDARADARLRKALGVAAEWISPDALLESLRWTATDEAHRGCDQTSAEALELARSQRRQAPPQPSSEPFVALIELAGEQILYMDLAAVPKTLKRAQAILPCTSSPLEPGQIRALYLYDAVTHVYLKDGKHSEAFLNMMAVDPRLFLEPDYPPRVQEAFLSTARTLMKVPMRTLDIGGMAGSILLNGTLLKGNEQVRTGLHVVQRVGPAGITRTAQLKISAGDGPFLLKDVPELQLPGTDEARSKLEQAVRAQQWNPAQAAVVQDLLKDSAVPWLLFALDDQSTDPPGAYHREEGWLEGERVKQLARAQARGRATPESAAGTQPRPPEKPAAPSRVDEDVAAPPTWSLTAHVGAGLTLSAPTEPRGGLLDLAVARAMTPLVQVGVFARLGLEGALTPGQASTSDGGAEAISYPSAGGGLLVGVLVRPASRLSLTPYFGYGVGRGPALALGCVQDTGSDSMSCSQEAGSTAAPITIVTPSIAHGPITRFGLLYHLSQGRPLVSVVATVQGQYLMLRPPAGGTVTTVSGSQLDYTVDQALAPRSGLRLETLLGLEVGF